MNYSKMDGYQFEDYIEKLLKELGFRVTNVGYSNDGGIDLIALYDAPIFKGKYIVQCKNWSEKVGQPAVRDLYGVIMDNRANKGILISTGDFTEQAYEFAAGKNIELINKKGLKTLEEMCAGTPIPEVASDKSFLSSPLFNSEKYKYILEKIDEDPSNNTYYEYALSFLGDYIFAEEYLGFEGIIDEYISICDSMLKRVYKKNRKSDECSVKELQMKKGFAYLINGDLDKAVESLFDIGRSWFTYARYNDSEKYRCLSDFIKGKSPTGKVWITTDQSYEIFKTFHHIFICLNFEKAVTFSEKFFCLKEEPYKVKFPSCHTFYEISMEKYEELLDNDPCIITIPKTITCDNKYPFMMQSLEKSYILDTRAIIDSWDKSIKQLEAEVMTIINIHSEI